MDLSGPPFLKTDFPSYLTQRGEVALQIRIYLSICRSYMRYVRVSVCTPRPHLEAIGRSMISWLAGVCARGLTAFCPSLCVRPYVCVCVYGLYSEMVWMHGWLDG